MIGNEKERLLVAKYFNLGLLINEMKIKLYRYYYFKYLNIYLFFFISCEIIYLKQKVLITNYNFRFN